ncbi:regulatory protein, luxR family [Xaviernesmea oryzae]|uniref:Regulatory protein, luxR family n=1 Tax=Xaviernesmea oryzae TaxID=464029 RepID=A0A1X7FY39_9HYPH|nr:AroM family protein [Xaviernesmea oryzae]SMF60834.1 regulatory protein, luxR family [Xaviernesmea oryzae]
MEKRVCFVTLGQSPRPELISEVMRTVGGNVAFDQVGALDGLTAEEVARHAPKPNEHPLVTQVKDGRQVVVSGPFIEERLSTIISHVDRLGYDLIILLSSGIFGHFPTSTPFLHGQLAVDEWIASFIMGSAQLGVVFPLRRQASDPCSLNEYGILIQNSRRVDYSGETNRIEETALLLGSADIILMHSVSYTEEMARQLAAVTRKPVITARRVIAGALHLRLMESHAPTIAGAIQASELNLIERLPSPNEPLTGREQEVLSLVLDGKSNKEIAKELGISHRTVEIHRSRAMGKYNATTAMQLIRRAMIQTHQ